MRPARTDWLAGLLTGLVTSTYSTLVVALGSRRIGRSARLDWMHLGSTLLRDRAITVEPRVPAMALGVLVHQAADIAWATVWGRIAGPLGRRRQPVTVAAWLPWSAATAWVEYTLVLSWWQPLVRIEVPYWTATTVHLSSRAAYPLLPLMRQALTGQPEDGRQFALASAAGLGARLAALAALAVVAPRRGEPRWPFAGPVPRAFDQAFLRAMVAHHEAGIELSALCAARAAHVRLRMLGRLMLGQHRSEVAIMRAWWRSWYGDELPAPTAADRAWMSGMPDEADLEALRRAEGAAFDRRFVALMGRHAEGGIAMADRARTDGGDPRIWLFGDTIAHTQRGQVTFMRRHTA